MSNNVKIITKVKRMKGQRIGFGGSGRSEYRADHAPRAGGGDARFSGPGHGWLCFGRVREPGIRLPAVYENVAWNRRRNFGLIKDVLMVASAAGITGIWPDASLV